jgi:hypothetical protein
LLASHLDDRAGPAGHHEKNDDDGDPREDVLLPFGQATVHAVTARGARQ